MYVIGDASCTVCYTQFFENHPARCLCSTLGDIMSTLGDVQYTGVSIQIRLFSPHLSWCPPTVLMISSHCTHDIPPLYSSGFSPGRLHMGGFVPPIWGGDKALMGGLMSGGIDLMGGPNFDRLYHKLKVLLLLSCSYTMQFIGYDSIKARWFISYRFQICTVTQHQYRRIGAINRIV